MSHTWPLTLVFSATSIPDLMLPYIKHTVRYTEFKFKKNRVMVSYLPLVSADMMTQGIGLGIGREKVGFVHP